MITNQLQVLAKNFSKEIKNYGITEAFMMDGELYTTSLSNIPSDLIELFEAEFKSI